MREPHPAHLTPPPQPRASTELENGGFFLVFPGEPWLRLCLEAATVEGALHAGARARRASLGRSFPEELARNTDRVWRKSRNFLCMLS
jgi:hypothetical protein